MVTCTSCGSRFDGAVLRVCPFDGAPLEIRVDPALGRTLAGRYELLAPLGKGQMADVYRARDLAGGGAQVAVKVLRPAMIRSPRLRERLLREARAARRIAHDNVVRLLDVVETDEGAPALVLELLCGRTLEEELRAGRPSVPDSLGVAHQVSSALAAAHALGVVHRDVKPANVLLERTGDGALRAKVVDFGLANVAEEEGLTATGELLGTPAYMAPERLEPGAATPAVDVYALGCVLFEMLTGTPPFSGSTVEVLDAHQRAEPRAPSSLVPTLDACVDALVLRLLAKDPARRGGARDAETELARMRAFAT